MTTPNDPSGDNPYEAPEPGSVPPPPPPGQPPYGQPQYGQPQYGQPPYGTPQWGGGQPKPGTNGFAIASLVCAFLCSPLGIIFGFVARSQIKQTGQRGDGLAIAGIILSILSLVIGIIVVSTGNGTSTT